MPPPPSSCLGAGGGCSGSDCSASGRTCSPQPGPSGLGSGVWAEPRADRSRSELHGRFSPAPLGAAEEYRDSVFGSVDLDWDDSFRCVLHLIREFHSIAPIYGLQSVFPGCSLASFPFA